MSCTEGTLVLKALLNKIRKIKTAQAIKKSSYFSSSWYLETYKEQLGGFKGNALAHYLNTVGKSVMICHRFFCVVINVLKI